MGLSQLKRLYEPDRYIYSEKASKNRPGGTAQLRMEHKIVPIYANPKAGIRCPVFLLDEYIRKLPEIAIEKDFFYCKPSPVTPKDGQPWYYPVPVGKNVLFSMVKEMTTEAGISGKKTNHSLRVTGATSLYRAGVPERIIQERTGHRSLQSLRQYERTSKDQEMAVSRILSGEVDNYDTSIESAPVTFKNDTTIKTEVKTEEELHIPSLPSSGAAVNYNNCTVNVFSGNTPYPQPSHCLHIHSLPHCLHIIIMVNQDQDILTSNCLIIYSKHSFILIAHSFIHLF